MKAWQLDDTTKVPVLLSRETPQPKPGPGELLVKVHAAGVTSAELSWYPTTHTKSGDPRHNAIPAHEFSGTAAALGEGTKGFALGDEIFGMNDWFADGAAAEFCTTRPEWITTKPPALTHAQAASVPISALTAWQALFEHAKLQKCERVLIHGGSGGVGSFAVQFAHRHGAHVITTASERNRDFLLNLGAQQVIDYHREHFESMVREIDVVFDTVGGTTRDLSWPVLTPTGRLVTIASDASDSADERVKKAFFIVEPKADQLAEIASQLGAGKLTTIIDAAVPFSQAAQAYSGKIEKTQGRGKVVIEIIPG